MYNIFKKNICKYQYIVEFTKIILTLMNLI